MRVPSRPRPQRRHGEGNHRTSICCQAYPHFPFVKARLRAGASVSNPKMGYSNSGFNVGRVIHASTPSSAYEALRRLLTQARLDAELTQAQVAIRLKRPQSFVSKYESGE